MGAPLSLRSEFPNIRSACSAGAAKRSVCDLYPGVNSESERPVLHGRPSSRDPDAPSGRSVPGLHRRAWRGVVRALCPFGPFGPPSVGTALSPSLSGAALGAIRSSSRCPSRDLRPVRSMPSGAIVGSLWSHVGTFASTASDTAPPRFIRMSISEQISDSLERALPGHGFDLVRRVAVELGWGDIDFVTVHSRLRRGDGSPSLGTVIHDVVGRVLAGRGDIR